MWFNTSWQWICGLNQRNQQWFPAPLLVTTKEESGSFHNSLNSEPFDSVCFFLYKTKIRRECAHCVESAYKSSSRMKRVRKYIPGAQTQSLSDLHPARTMRCQINTTNLNSSKCQRLIIIISDCWILDAIMLMFPREPLSLQRFPSERKRKPHVRRRHVRC